MGKSRRIRSSHRQVHFVGSRRGPHEVERSVADSPASHFTRTLWTDEEGIFSLNRRPLEGILELSFSLYIRVDKVGTATFKRELVLKIDTPSDACPSLVVTLDAFFYEQCRESAAPAWAHYVHAEEWQPVRLKCPIFWLLQYAKATTDRAEVVQTARMIPWWRIIRWTTYVLRLEELAQLPQCDACRQMRAIKAEEATTKQRIPNGVEDVARQFLGFHL